MELRSCPPWTSHAVRGRPLPDAVRRGSPPIPIPRRPALAEGGLRGAPLARPLGLGADPDHQLIVDDELRRAGVRRPENTIGIGWAGPTILLAGSRRAEGALPAAPAGRRGDLVPAVQRAGRGLRPGLADHPGRARRRRVGGRRARRCGPRYAHGPQFGILLARTEPGRPEHQGISYFICPMDTPGVTVRPLVDMTGTHTFNEVFLDERAPAGRQPGRATGARAGRWPRSPWATSGSRCPGPGSLWGMGPTAADLVDAGAPRRRRSPTRSSASAWPGCGPRARSSGCCGCGPSPRRWPAPSPVPRRRCARRWPTSTASTSWPWPGTWPARPGMLAGAGPVGRGAGGTPATGLAGRLWDYGFSSPRP